MLVYITRLRLQCWALLASSKSERAYDFRTWTSCVGWKGVHIGVQPFSIATLKPNPKIAEDLLDAEIKNSMLVAMVASTTINTKLKQTSNPVAKIFARRS